MAPIHYAARDGNAEALRRELERGVSPEAPEDGGRTPLSIAVVYHDVE